MGRNSHDEMDLRKIRKLLRETTRLAERASMTGSLQGGGRIAIRQYNAIRDHLQDTGVIPDDLFQELDEDEATFDELGVVTGMLESYLEDDSEGCAEADGEQPGEEGEARRGRKARRHGRWDWGAWMGPAGARFVADPQALRDLQQLGEELRQHLPELLFWRDKMRSEHPQPPAPPGAPPAPGPVSAPGTPTPPDAPQPPPGAAPPAVMDRIRQIAQALQSEDMDHNRRMELTRELAELLTL
jgi:hypothetical protein